MSESLHKTDDLLQDLCSRWERGDRAFVEALLQDHPSAALSDQALLDLVYKECLLREEAGEAPTLAEYQRRFPRLRDELRAQFEVHRMMAGEVPERRTQAGGPTPPPGPPAVFSAETPPSIPGYEVLGVLAGGGMGIIYKARQLRLNRFVAIKVIRPERINSAAAVRRFQRETLAAARLAHPYIVHVFDANQAGNLHYLVMEYVEGVDLAQLVRDRGPLLLPQACQYIRQAAIGLQHAHERGLVHRDIKPSNLMLSNDGLIKVLDLGLARVQQPDPGEESASHLTQAGSVLGTPDYMAPEQVEDPHGADIRSDLYSLGCTFFFLLTGKVLFPGGSMIQKLDRHRWQPPPSLSQLRSDLLPEVAAILAKLLAKKPAERFQTPAELASSLLPFVPADRPSGIQRAETALPRSDVPTQGRSEGPAAVAGPAPGVGRQLLGHGDWVTAVAFAPDGRCVSTSRDRTLRLWDPASAKEIGRWEVHADSVQCVAFTPDGNRVVTGSRDRTVRVWDLTTGRELACLVGHSGEVTSVAVAPDGRTVLTGSEDQTVRLWSLDTGRELRRIGGTVAERHWDGVLCVAYTPDGRRALSGSRDKTLRLWDLTTGRELRCFRGPSLPIHCLALAPDGRHALSGGGHTVRVWDLETGQMVRRLKGHQKAVLSLACSADGGWAVSGSEDRTVRVWDLVNGGDAQRLDGHVSWVTTVAVAPDGRMAVSGSADRSVCLWRIPAR